MDPLTWTGSLAGITNAVLLALLALLVLSGLVVLIAVAVILLNALVRIIIASVLPRAVAAEGAGPTLSGSLLNFAGRVLRLGTLGLQVTALLAVAAFFALLLAGVVMPYGSAGIIGAISKQFLPVWIALVVTYALSIRYRRRLGLYGKLFDSTVGMIGFGLVMFWVFTAIAVGVFGLIATHDPLAAVSGLKNKEPGIPMPDAEAFAVGAHYLLGGDNLARDVFSRMVHGSWIVVQIAPLATLFSFMMGITLGLPAGYYSGRLDTVLSFIANLILAFPVILLFYLLVTPEIVDTGIPSWMATFLFLFPILFVGVLLHSRYRTRGTAVWTTLGPILAVMFWIYLSLINQTGTPMTFLPPVLDLFDVPSGILVVFVSVVFVNAPTVFRIVRGLTMDIKTRDYVAAAQTRGEGVWYIMLWEILPNARGPLIVDFCLRIGYTTILLGTLGFFGLGLPPDSPDWGSTINSGRQLLSVFPHPALVPAVALLSLVLGLNLLADGLREESLKD